MGLASVRPLQYGAVKYAEYRRLNDWLTDLTAATISLVPPADGPPLTARGHQDMNYGSPQRPSSSTLQKAHSHPPYHVPKSQTDILPSRASLRLCAEFTSLPIVAFLSSLVPLWPRNYKYSSTCSAIPPFRNPRQGVVRLGAPTGK